MKGNENPDTIARVKNKEIRFQEEYENWIGVWDSTNEDVGYNTIKTLIEEINQKPLADWKVGDGEVRITIAERYGKDST